MQQDTDSSAQLADPPRHVGTDDPRGDKGFIAYYLPCLFLLLATTSLSLALVLAPRHGLAYVAILAFAIYRWYASGWAPNPLNRKNAYARKEQAHAQHLRDVRAGAAPLTATAMMGPGLLTKISLWIESRLLAFVAMLVIWMPMELFIQIKFLLRAIAAKKKGEFLLTRRGPWPGEEDHASG